MLSALVKQRLEVPGEAGAWVEIRKLGWRALREASETMSKMAFETVRALGKEGLEAVRSVTPEQIAASKTNVAAQYDTGAVLRGGILAWSYSDKPTPAEIDDLTEDVAEWLKEQILALSRPPRDEATVKNG